MISLKTSLKLLQIEVVLTGTLISMPIMVPFFNSIGMDQGQIGLSQALFTVSILLLNIPAGWLADRFSRKMSNAFGDFGCVVTLILYSQVTTLSGVIACEVLFGLSLAFSQGADGALIKAHCDKMDEGDGLFRHINATNAIWRPSAQIFALMIGGAVGSSNPRLVIAISAIPFFIGAVFSLFIREEGDRLIAEHRNPLKDMVRVVKVTVYTKPKVRWLILAYALGFRITHVMIWALTPIFVYAGLPLKIIAIGWILNSISGVIGARVARRYHMYFYKWQRFALPSILVVVALCVMSINLSLSTVWLYSILGMAHGWNSAVLKPMIQEEIASSNQAIALSIANTFSQLIYIPLIWIVSFAGNVDIRLSMVATVILFTPAIIVTALKLKNLEME